MSHGGIIRGGGRPSEYLSATGKKLPGVTTILGATIPKPALIPWAYEQGKKGVGLYTARDVAGDIGSAVHKAVEEYEYSGAKPSFLELRDTAMGDEARAPRESAHLAFEAYLDWRSWQAFEVIALEVPLASDRLGYAGTLDILGRRGKRLSLIDLKTGGAVYWEMILQVAGYAELWEAERGERIEEFEIIRTNKDGTGFEHWARTRAELEAANAFTAWRRCVELYTYQSGLKALTKTPKKKAA
jgi:hypothetical protein